MSKRPSVQLLVGRGYSLPCAVTLDALFDSGAKIVTHGKWILIVRESLHGEMIEHAKYASANCAQVAVVSGSPADLQYLERVIRTAIADTFFTDAWESQQEYIAQENRGYKKKPAPKTRPDAKAAAREFIKRMESANGLPIAVMYQVASQVPHTDSWHREGDATEFGAYTAFQALGHGVSWEDHHPAHGFKVPDFEYYL